MFMCVCIHMHSTGKRLVREESKGPPATHYLTILGKDAREEELQKELCQEKVSIHFLLIREVELMK